MDFSIFLIIFIISIIAFFTLRNYIPSSSYNILNICYLISILIFQIFLNMQISNHVCGFYNTGNVLMVTLVPWVLIMGSLFALLNFFPNWLNPFANTFGVLFTSFPINMYALFDSQQLLSKKNKIMNFLNENNLNDVSKFVNDNKISYNVSGNTIDLIPYLNDIINNKLEISNFIWYGLSIILIFGISISSIFTSSCNISVKEMKKRNKQNNKVN